MSRLMNIGFGNAVNTDRVLAAVNPDAAPVRRMVSSARERDMLIDATQGRKTKSVILMDSDHIVLSYLNVESIDAKLEGEQ